MQQTPRRSLLRAAGTGAVVAVAGCSLPTFGSQDDNGADGSADSDESGYAVYAETLAAVSRPFHRSATGVTEQIITDVTTQTAELAETAVGGSSTAALEGILSSVQTAFEALRDAQQAFALEQVRGQVKAAAGEDVKVRYENGADDRPFGIGRRWDRDRPCAPLFSVLEADFRALADADTAANRERIRRHAEAVDAIFTLGQYMNHVERVSGYRGAEPLLKSLEFLLETTDWIRSNIEVEPSVGDATGYRTDFASGLDGWTTGLHPAADARVNPGEATWVQQHGGSVHLHVEGGPNHVGVYRAFDGLDEGMTIRATYESPNLQGSPGGPRILLHTPDGETHNLDWDKGQSNDTDGTLEGTVPRDVPDGTDLEIRLGVWPGEIDVYVTRVEIPHEGVSPSSGT